MKPLILRHTNSGSILLAKAEKDLNSFQFFLLENGKDGNGFWANK